MVQTLETPVQELSLEDARREVYALNDLKGRISELIDVRWNHGPFVLAHSDLRPPNIIVDEHLNIQAIVDWEWAGTIPRQFFMPPTWLVGELPCYVASTDYSREYAEFYAVFAAKGTPCCRQLADEWGLDLPRGLEFPLAVLLRHHSQFASTYYLAIYPKFFKTPSAETVSRFFEQQDGDNSSFTLQVRRCIETSERYTQHLKSCGLFVENEQARKVREWLERKRQIEEKWDQRRQQRQQEREQRLAELAAAQKMRREKLLKPQPQSLPGPSSPSPDSPAPLPCS